MTERDEQVFTIYRHKDTGKIVGMGDLAFIQTDLGLQLYNTIIAANKKDVQQ